MLTQNPNPGRYATQKNDLRGKNPNPRLADVITIRRGEDLFCFILCFLSGMIGGGVVVYFVLSHGR
jgi:hypothetical protein